VIIAKHIAWLQLQHQRNHLLQVLRLSLARGSEADRHAAALVVSRAAVSPKPREAMIAEGLLPALIAIVASGEATGIFSSF
jgi:hypothetical protein